VCTITQLSPIKFFNVKLNHSW